MTEAERKKIEEQLRAHGIPLDSWKTGGAVDLADLPALARQRALLKAATEALRAQLASDQEELEAARCARARLRQGGGT